MYTPEVVLSQGILVQVLMEYDGPVLSQYILDHQLMLVLNVDRPYLPSYHEVLHYVKENGLPPDEATVQTALLGASDLHLYAILDTATATAWDSESIDLRTAIQQAEQLVLQIYSGPSDIGVPLTHVPPSYLPEPGVFKLRY